MWQRIADWFRKLFGIEDEEPYPAPAIGKEYKRKVLIVGIYKYRLPGADLRGCVADARAYHRAFSAFCEPHEMMLLLDKQATHRNYPKALEWMMDLRPGQRAILCHSGHGTQVDQGYTGTEEDLIDEALVLHDSSYRRVFTDKDFVRAIKPGVNAGVLLTAVFDVCFGEGMYRFVPNARSRFLRNPTLGGLPHRVRRFGMRPVRPNAQRHLLLAACQEAETAAEAIMSDGTWRGAFSWHLLRNFSSSVTWEQMFAATMRDMRFARLRQTPAMVGGYAIRGLRPFEP